MNLLLDFWPIATNLRPERNEHISRYFSILTNLGRERHEHSFSRHFHDIETRKSSTIDE